jgi:hypothetical protein
MPFMVIYGTSDGASCYEQADAIDEAALFVERLRNQDGIDQIRIFRMEEISFAFRPYYKVELGLPERKSAERSSAAGSPPPVDDDMGPAEPVAPVVEADSVPPVVEESAVPVPASPDGAVDGRRGLFGR